MSRGLESPVVVQKDGKDVLPQILELSRNRLYVMTTMLVAAIMLVASGITFLWVRFFVHAFAISKSSAVVGFLVSQGLGGVVGIAFGPLAIDRCGGFLDNDGRYRSLQFISAMMATSMSGAMIILGCICLKWRSGGLGVQDPQDTQSVLLWVIWTAFFVVFASFNAGLAGLTGINIGAVPPAMRSLASGCTVSVQNLLGYALGPLVPGAVMDLAESHVSNKGEDAAGAAQLMCLGLGSVLLFTGAMLGFALAALREAQLRKVVEAAEAEASKGMLDDADVLPPRL